MRSKIFHKLNGAGNCFLISDLRDARMRVPKTDRRRLARELCDVHTSIGADGLLFLENSRKADLQWDFYNADGSSAEMCGNAARCVGAFLLRQYNRKAPMTILTKSGVVTVEPLGHGEFRVAMPSIREIEVGRDFDFVDSGVPHAVIKLDKPSRLQDPDTLNEYVTRVRSEKRFKKRGVNVTFYALASHNARNVQSLTFERGVAGYTQACGTGAVAAATSFAAHNPKPLSRATSRGDQIKVSVPGGRLIVELGGERPLLTGPAAYIAEIRV